MQAFILLIMALLAPAAAPAPATRPADFAIRDGDTVVFLGDSITAARTYGNLIELYTLLRYPQRKARFINAGRGGDTAAGGLARLERDVLARGATLVTVAYGINDIGWGGAADDAHRKKYLDSIRGIVETCKRRGVRVFICSAASTAGDTDDNNYLQRMCDDGMAIARSLGEGAIDVQRYMRQAQRRINAAKAADPKLQDTMHAADSIHLNELGQLAMAVAILKGLGAPAEVSAATLDARGPALLQAAACTVTDVTARPAGGIEFTRRDEGLPFNLEPLWGLRFRYLPIPDELNQYMLTVRNLPAGRYDLLVEERAVGTFTAEQLAGGVNIASATADPWRPGGPWDAQAHLAKMLVDAENKLTVARTLVGEFVRTNPNRPQIETAAEDVDTRLAALLRAVVQPVPYRFVIRPAAPTSAPK